MSADRDSKIIGYFAMRSPQAVVCTGPACVIAGSENAMRGFLEELHPGNNAQHIIRKTRFSEIMAGMRLGAPYAFDEESFARFYPLALEVGLPVAKPDFAEALKRGNRFLTLEIIRA